MGKHFFHVLENWVCKRKSENKIAVRRRELASHHSFIGLCVASGMLFPPYLECNSLSITLPTLSYCGMKYGSGMIEASQYLGKSISGERTKTMSGPPRW